MSAGALSAGERSYPISEVRGSGLECQAAMAQERPRGATLCPRSGAAAGRSYPASEVRAATERRHPASEVRAAKRSHLAPEARGGDPEEPPEERWLRRRRRA